jgi:hypothetical protein
VLVFFTYKVNKLRESIFYHEVFLLCVYQCNRWTIIDGVGHDYQRYQKSSTIPDSDAMFRLPVEIRRIFTCSEFKIFINFNLNYDRLLIKVARLVR